MTRRQRAQAILLGVTLATSVECLLFESLGSLLIALVCAVAFVLTLKKER